MRKVQITLYGETESDLCDSLREISMDIYSEISNRINPKQRKFTGHHSVETDLSHLGTWEERGFWECNVVSEQEFVYRRFE